VGCRRRAARPEYRLTIEATIDLWEGNPQRAADRFAEAARRLEGDSDLATRINALSGCSKASLAAGSRRRPCRFHQAVELQHGGGTREIQGIDPIDVWWRHYLALRANGRSTRHGGARRDGVPPSSSSPSPS
jgi:hypothetical protein